MEKRRVQGFETADPIKYKLLKGFVEDNRRVSTQAEEVLWGVLRGKQLEGYKFRRQHIIDSFIADFVCLSKQLVIELDGKYHQLPEMVISDAERTERLNELGFDVLRFKNDEVLVDIEGTSKQILERLELLDKKPLWFQKTTTPTNVKVPSSHPSPFGGGWEGAVRVGVLLCINGAGSLYRWLRQTVGQGNISYPDMERLAASVPVGADGLRILPFGNGAERMLANLDPGAQVNNLQFNRHTAAHLYRAGLDGIAFSFVYGVQILKEMGLDISVMRVGNDNLFQSAVFSKTIATLLGCSIDVVQTTGAVGAAKAAGVATGIYPSIEAAMASVTVTGRYEPEVERVGEYRAAYAAWERDLGKAIA
jgi:very-short-patch-repair endonuclease